MNYTKNIVWQSLSWPSTVMLRFESGDSEIKGSGFAAGKTDQGRPFAIKYEVDLTANGDIKTVSIVSLLDERSIAVRYEDGRWLDGSGAVLEEFDGVPFFDISVSPFTNSLPTQKLSFEDEAPQTIDMVYFDENAFSLRKVQQMYSKIGDKSYRYQDVEQRDFVANISVDEDGLVVDFEYLFKRV